MRFAKTAATAAILTTILGAAAAQAGGQYQLQQVGPQRIVPIMNCRLEPFGDAYGIYVFNGANVAYTLPQGSQVGWILSNGRQGVFTIGAGGLAAGSGLLVDVSGTYENCTARVL